MRKFFVLMGAMIAVFLYIMTAQESGGIPSPETMVVTGGILAIAAPVLAVVVVVVISITVTDSLREARDKARKLLLDKQSDED